METRNEPQDTTGQPDPQTPIDSGREEAINAQQTVPPEDINDGAPNAEESTEALPPPPPGLPASYPRQGRPTIRKGVYLSALIYVEGDRPPAQDFTREAKAALQQALAAALGDTPDGLTMSLKRIKTQNNVEDEEPDDEGHDANANIREEGKFEF